jgi:hypothetical protein
MLAGIAVIGIVGLLLENWSSINWATDAGTLGDDGHEFVPFRFNVPGSRLGSWDVEPKR